MKKVCLYYSVVPGSEDCTKLEYFCRGAIAMSSKDFDWILDTGTNHIAIFCADTLFEQKIKIIFGEPHFVRPFALPIGQATYQPPTKKCYHWFAKYLYRKDKFGQCHQMVCLHCPHKTNWHTDRWQASVAFRQ